MQGFGYTHSFQETMASLATPFSKIVRMCTNHLATKQLLFKIADIRITVVCVKIDLQQLLTQCLKRAWSMILQPILQKSTEEANTAKIY